MTLDPAASPAPASTVASPRPAAPAAPAVPVAPTIATTAPSTSAIAPQGTPATRLSGNLAQALGAAGAALARVARGSALDRALDATASALNPAERAAAQDIAYSACRRLNLLDAIAARLMSKPNAEVDYLIRAALSELIDHSEARAHTITDQAVVCAAGLAQGAFKGLVNGVLRRFLREREALLSALLSDEALRLAYPRWWIDRVRDAWPAHWQPVLDAGNHAPAMTLRVNLRRCSVEAYAATLDAAGIAAHRTGPVALTLERAIPVARLPGFAEGLVSVQDLGAQWAAHLAVASLQAVNAAAPGAATAGPPVPPLRILDACAAPGGKSAHLLELLDCALTALDNDARRLDTVKRNLNRLGLEAHCHAADASKPDAWWDGVPFDFVLVDAPCTASGVVSRHPDGKWLKRASDSAQLARIQRRLLDALWRTVKPGGTLLYATCSLFPAENALQFEAWLSTHPDAQQCPLPIAHPSLAPHALHWHDGQLLPGARHGGFFYALARKA